MRAVGLHGSAAWWWGTGKGELTEETVTERGAPGRLARFKRLFIKSITT